MIDLTTSYMGLQLKNPLVVSSCGLTKTVQGVQQAAAAGAGAIVLKSLFEEQIMAETEALMDNAGATDHTEALEYLRGYGHALGPREYLQLVRDAKQSVQVPIIASVNCVTAERWPDYARQLANAGADAIEINVGFLPNDPDLTGAAVEERYEQILSAVRSRIELPVALKIGPYFSSLAHMADRLGNDRMTAPPFMTAWSDRAELENTAVRRGADALVLFNRFYRFDINVDTIQLAGGNPYSTPEELHLPLRWISLLSGRIDCDLAATTGVHTGPDAIKLLLAGATVVQLCSTLYRNGLGQIELILAQLQKWMQARQFECLADFRGRLSQAKSEDPASFERVQYIKALVGID